MALSKYSLYHHTTLLNPSLIHNDYGHFSPKWTVTSEMKQNTEILKDKFVELYFI